MEIHVQSIHFDADITLLTYVEKKVEKLETFFDRIESAEVYLRLSRETEHRENKIVEVKLLIPGHTLFSKEIAPTFEAAIDMATEALKVQVKKNKEKLRERAADISSMIQGQI